MIKRPVKHDGDRETPLVITCAWCGKVISFEKSEVYLSPEECSYVCYTHSFRDCRTCKFGYRKPGYFLCQHPTVIGKDTDPSTCADGIPGVSAAYASGREPGLPYRPDPAPCAGYKLWQAANT
jgi:hypothetical protein